MVAGFVCGCAYCQIFPEEKIHNFNSEDSKSSLADVFCPGA